MKYLWVLSIVWLSGCATVPDGLEPVTGFEVERFMGKWYEIERLESNNELGLTNVSADYRLLSDGKIEIIHRGYKPRQKSWSMVTGLAWFAGNKDVGSLKLSFGSPFNGAYNILVLDTQYRYAMVADNDRDDLWILSREPQLDKAIMDSLVAKAKAWGFPTNNLVYVEQKALPK
jgi:apolipoprotein D and lipocalin family protein